MSENIGVISVYNLQNLKNYSLMVDKVFISNPWEKLHMTQFDSHDLRHYCSIESINADVDWLRNKDFVISYVPSSDILKSAINSNQGYQEAAQAACDIMLSPAKSHDLQIMGEYIARRDTALLNSANMNAIPFLPAISSKLPRFNTPITREQVINFTLNKVPIPDESTSWEQIIDFKNDPDSKDKFLAIKTWINKVVREKFDLNDVEDEFEYLMTQYDKHIQLHKMKSKKSLLEISIVGTAELIENIAKLKISKLSQRFFSIKQRKIELLQNEQNAPGKELAYVYKKQQNFSLN